MWDKVSSLKKEGGLEVKDIRCSSLTLWKNGYDAYEWRG